MINSLLWKSTFLLALPLRAFAQEYDGGGLTGGIDDASQTGVTTETDIRQLTIDIVSTLLGYLALAAVTMIIIAGLYMIFGMGSETSRDTAKKIIMYVLIGLILILMAGAIVAFVQDIADVAQS
jgi:type IV secretory pathway VirB2 component (pilin)